MYNYIWDKETGGYLLITKITGATLEIRPVYKEELQLLGFDTQYGWHIQDTDLPLMWAEGRRYIYFGEKIAEAVGGGLYDLPTLKACVRDIELKPVDIQSMLEKNRALMTGWEQKALKFIYSTYKEHLHKADITYVAFSGGKDSIVMLDLVQRALPHDGFKVVFGDTTMELKSTYRVLECAKKRWNDLSWHTAQAPFDAYESWIKFGPPARTIRWCCCVHKSAPSILKIKELLAEERGCTVQDIHKFKTLAFLGIRAEESEARSAYGLISDGNKHAVQINCNPILEWNTCELFLYIFQHSLPLNDAYRNGSSRIGCVLCPMSAKWYECILHHAYTKELSPYIDRVISSIKKDYDDEKSWQKYLSEGGWKQRASGKALKISSNKILETESDDILQFVIRESNHKWDTWLPAIGAVIPIDNCLYQISYEDVTASFDVIKNQNIITIVMHKQTKTPSFIRFIYLFKNAIYKAAYCEGCQACMAECPSGALQISPSSIMINRCIHCENCLQVGRRGCWVCKSKMSAGDGNMSIKNIDRYKNFGFRQDWLKIFFEDRTKFWENDRMGSHMFLSFRAWAKEAGFLDASNNSLRAADKLITLGYDSPLVWAFIFNNLAYESSITNWFIRKFKFNEAYKASDMQIMLGDTYSETTKKNALSALKDTLKSSPIGWLLGQGDCEMKGKVVTSITRYGWMSPEPLAILYCLYKYAEMSDYFYSFTLYDLYDEHAERAGLTPAQLYNIDREMCKQIIIALARDYGDFITVNFNKDLLEDIYLTSDKTSNDVVDLF